jgi:hypothetical protein
MPRYWQVGAGVGVGSKLQQDKTVELKPCLAFTGSGNLHPEPVAGAQYLYLTSQVWTDTASDNVMSMSAFGIKDAVLVINGKRVGRKIVFRKGGKLGEDWVDAPVKLVEGGNKIEVFVRPSTAERPALRFKIQPFAEYRLAQLLQPVEDKTRNDLMKVPGILLASHLLNGGDEDFYNPKSQLYELFKDPRLLDEYIYYTTNKREVADIFIKFADSAPHVITSYHFQPRFGRFPPNWKFEGSNDGKQWTTLDDVTGFRQRGRNWVYNKNLDNQKPYKEYRFHIPPAPFLVAWKDLRIYGE